MLGCAAASIVLLVASVSAAAAGGTYFPLSAGNWWSYQELDGDGRALSRETWTVLDAAPADRTGEFHLRSFTKRLDMLGHMGRRWEGHEFLRTTDLGLHKRYPASGRDKEFEVTLLREPVAAGTRWHDAQGDCEVISLGGGAGLRLVVAAVSLGRGGGWEAGERGGRPALPPGRVAARARRCDPGALAERTGIGIPLLVSPEPGAVAESAGWPPVHD